MMTDDENTMQYTQNHTISVIDWLMVIAVGKAMYPSRLNLLHQEPKINEQKERRQKDLDEVSKYLEYSVDLEFATVLGTLLCLVCYSVMY